LILSAEVGLIRIVESAYDLSGGMDAWLERLGRAAQPVLDRGFGLIALSCTFDRNAPGTFEVEHAVPLDVSEPFLELFLALHTSTLPEQMRAIHGIQTGVFGLADTFGGKPPRLFEELGRPLGARDSLTVCGANPNGTQFALSLASPKVELLDPRVRRVWARVGAHVAAGGRLMKALSPGGDATRVAVEAIVEPGGRVVHAEGPAQSQDAREAFRRAARAIDRARGPLRDDDGALELWHALVAGRWSLLDRFESDGRRYLVARRNDDEVRDPRGLTTREQQIAARAALGHSNKLIAYELGVSPSTVATFLTRALKKLGCTTRAELRGALPI
jgi:DNA-binding NarL/FixJ family response regulator